MNDTNQYGGDFINWDIQWNYPLQWIYESIFARDAYRALLFRTSLAKVGLPSKNLYKETMLSNLNKLKKTNEKDDKYTNLCAELPIGRSFALANAVDNRANQLAGGVESYECEVNDPYMVVDDETEDLLAAKCQQDYIVSGLKDMASQFSDDLTWAGMTAVLIKYCPETDLNTIYRVNPKNVWFDTKYSSLGQERFRGYSTMISWATLLKMIEADKDEINPNIDANTQSLFDEKGAFRKTAKITKTRIRTLNDLNIYVQDLNKLATSSQLQSQMPEQFGEYLHDLNSCYNLGWYKTNATNAEARTKSGYNGDDVELTVMYDLERKIEFKIINRRYVISANSKCFRRKIPYEIINPVTQTLKITKKEYCLNCPLIFKFERKNMDMSPYPQAPVFPLLDEHDNLCAQIAKRQHVTNIISLLRIVANSADAESLGRLINIMGVILDDIQGDIQTVALNYNYEPIDSEINRLENLIKTRLKGYDEFDAMQAMGDRASAAESGMATGAVAQGLTTLQQTVMGLYADIARQCIGNRVTYAPIGNFRVWNGGDYSSLSIQEMSLLTIVDVKPKLAKKVQERAIATNALAMVGNLGKSGLINQDGIAYLMEQALFGQMPRGLAAKFVNKPSVTPETIAANAQQGANMAQALQQNQMAYEANPTAYEAVDAAQNLTPDEMDQLIAQYAQEVEQPVPAGESMPQDQGSLVDMQEQEVGLSLGENADIGSEAAGILANANSMV